MVDNKLVMEQFAEFEKLLNHYNQHALHIDKAIVVCSFIDKLPSFWKDFKRDLKFKKEETLLKLLLNSFE